MLVPCAYLKQLYGASEPSCIHNQINTRACDAKKRFV